LYGSAVGTSEFNNPVVHYCLFGRRRTVSKYCLFAFFDPSNNRLHAAVLTAPSSVDLDHFSLAKQTGEGLRRALLYCEDDLAIQYSSNIPTYSLSHSLGGKLQTIYMGATQQDFDGICLVSFNKVSFGQTVNMGRMFA
jgi:hypothetical protein